MKFYKKVPLVPAVFLEYTQKNERASSYDIDYKDKYRSTPDNEIVPLLLTPDLESYNECEQYMTKTAFITPAGLRYSPAVHFSNPEIKDSDGNTLVFCYHLGSKSFNSQIFRLSEVSSGVKIKDFDTVRKCINFVMALNSDEKAEYTKVREAITRDLSSLRATKKLLEAVYKSDREDIHGRYYADVKGYDNGKAVQFLTYVSIDCMRRDCFRTLKEAVYKAIQSRIEIHSIRLYFDEYEIDEPILQCDDPDKFK